MTTPHDDEMGAAPAAPTPAPPAAPAAPAVTAPEQVPAFAAPAAPVAPAPAAPAPVAPAPEPARELPRPPEGFNLDTLEREDTPKEPYKFVLDGHQYVMIDPSELDWQTLLSVMQQPLRLMQALLPEADQGKFFEAKLAAWKLDRLAEDFLKYYDFPPLGSASGSQG